MATKVLDPDQISVIFGTHSVRGWAAGEFLTLVMESDDFSDEVGTDGDDVTRVKSNDRRATLTLKLMQTSDSNDILSAISNADIVAANGAGITALLIRDRSTGRAIYRAAETWVAKAPDVNYDRSAQPREWKIRIAKLERFDGGN